MTEDVVFPQRPHCPQSVGRLASESRNPTGRMVSRPQSGSGKTIGVRSLEPRSRAGIPLPRREFDNLAGDPHHLSGSADSKSLSSARADSRQIRAGGADTRITPNRYFQSGTQSALMFPIRCPLWVASSVYAAHGACLLMGKKQPDFKNRQFSSFQPNADIGVSLLNV